MLVLYFYTVWQKKEKIYLDLVLNSTQLDSDQLISNQLKSAQLSSISQTKIIILTKYVC